MQNPECLPSTSLPSLYMVQLSHSGSDAQIGVQVEGVTAIAVGRR